MMRYELSIMGVDHEGNETAWIPWRSKYKTHRAAKQAMEDIRKSNEGCTYGRKWRITDTKDGASDIYVVMDNVRLINNH